MNLLKDGLISGSVKKTERAMKMTVDGLTETYPVYLVRLDLLYFNDQNDRISTWISQYKADHKIDSIDKSNIEKYNDIIEAFIYSSNPDKLKGTQKNIEYIGQQEPGVVLSDGRIIDGNRRFTCLRRLAKENPQFNYFETVILDKKYEHDIKQIKMLELQLQIGAEARVDYDPIDKLAGIYRDIEKLKLLTVEEYARSANLKITQVNKELELARLLADFLEAINAPEQFYIARDLNLNGPLHELHGALKKVKSEDMREQMKYIAFTNLLIQPDSDMTRFIRKLKNIATSQYVSEFVEKEMEVAEEVLDALPGPGYVTSDTVAKARANEEARDSLTQIMDTVSFKVDITEKKNKPVQMLIKAIEALEAIDEKVLKKLNIDQLEEFDNKLVYISQLVEDLEGIVDV